MIITQPIKTPIGAMIAGVADDRLCLFDFTFRKMMPAIRQRLAKHLQADFKEGQHELFDELKHQIEAYFNGERTDFDLPTIYTGTEYQQKVWQGLKDIPYGQTRSYIQQAAHLGDKNAVRAVAKANGENCLAIIVPCHRVVGSDGSLTGYAGGLAAKKWLLQHEAKVVGKSYQPVLF